MNSQGSWIDGEEERLNNQYFKVFQSETKSNKLFVKLLVSLTGFSETKCAIIGDSRSSVTWFNSICSPNIGNCWNDQSPLKCRAWWTPPWVGPKRQTHQRGRTHTGSGAYPTTTSPSCSTRMSPFSRTSRFPSESKWFQNMHPGEHPGVSFIQVNKDGRSSCNFEDCPNSPTANVVQTFAGSNKVWW